MGGTPSHQFIKKCISICEVIETPIPEIIIETGTYYGKGALIFSEYFKIVHTIELSEKWYKKSSNTLLTKSNIFCHLGNSTKILPTIMNQYNEPLVFYLDAHYSGSDTAFGDCEVPLLEEITSLQSRKQKDLIIVDDLRLFGSKGICGHVGHKFYPPMNYDWTDITIDSILHILGNASTTYYTTFDDRLVIIRNLSEQEIKKLR